MLKAIPFEVYGSPQKILGSHAIIVVCTKPDNENLVTILKFQEFTKCTFNFMDNSTNHLFPYFTKRSPLRAFNVFIFFWILCPI